MIVGQCVCGLTDMKSFLGITSNSDDTLISSLIDSVVESIENFCRRDFSVQVHNEKLDINDNQDIILLGSYPIISIAGLTDYSRTLVEGTDYYANYKSGVIKLIKDLDNSDAYFESGRQKTQISYISGYLLVPKALNLATKKICSRMYNNRDGLVSERIGSYGYNINLSPEGFTSDEIMLLKPFQKIGGFSSSV